jgi:hypothetical protein
VKRLLLVPRALYGGVLDGVRVVRTVLARAGGGVRVDQAAQQEALRAVLADAAARRRVRPGGPARAVDGPCLAQVTRRIERAAELLAVIEAARRDEPRLAQVARRIGRAGGLVAVLEAARRDEPTVEVPGLARSVRDPGSRPREARGGLEIGR